MKVGKADINELDAHLVRDAADDGGLAQSRHAPDHQREKDMRQLGMLRKRPELHAEDFLQLAALMRLCMSMRVLVSLAIYLIPYGVVLL